MVGLWLRSTRDRTEHRTLQGQAKRIESLLDEHIVGDGSERLERRRCEDRGSPLGCPPPTRSTELHPGGEPASHSFSMVMVWTDPSGSVRIVTLLPVWISAGSLAPGVIVKVFAEPSERRTVMLLPGV